MPIVLKAAVFALLLTSLPAQADLQSLIDQAPPGATVRVPPGRHRGHFVVTRPLSLTAEHDAILDGEGQGTILKIAGPGILVDGLVFENTGTSIGQADSAISAENTDGLVLRNLVVRNSLFGVQLLASKNALIENNDLSSFQDFDVARRGDVIKIWYSPGTRLLSNRMHDGRDVLVWYSDDSTIKGNVIERMRYAIHYMYSHRNFATGNTLRLNSVGIYGMYSNDLKIVDNEILANRGPSGYGVAIKESDRIRLENNRLVSNRVGLHLDNSPLSAPASAADATVFEGNRLALNDVGVTFVGGGSGSMFVRNDFVDNWQQVSTKGLRQSATIWSSNYWSDYRGVDPRRTGVGLFPYSADSLADEITDRYEGFKLFSFGPALLAVQFAERMVPWFRASPKATDRAPVMSPRTESANARASASGRLLVACFALFLAAVATALRKGFQL